MPMSSQWAPSVLAVISKMSSTRRPFRFLAVFPEIPFSSLLSGARRI